MVAPPPIRLVCARCKGALDARGEEPVELFCARCAIAFPRSGGIADFAEGRYYDDFPGPEVLSAENLRGLANESEGARIEGYYAPLLDGIAAERGLPRPSLRVLDSGCGNGESVDALSGLGFEAWGHDLSALRKWQWRERERRDRLVVASGETLPFSDGAFDAVIASGVLEHIGVSEAGGGTYRVAPMPDRDARRLRYLAELLRVLAPDGRLFLDFPNGAFPIDFWHGAKPGGARWHSVREGFLPTVLHVRALVAGLGAGWRVTALSPEGRLRFRQVSAHWYGRALRAPMAALYRLMSTRAFRFLAASPLNPYLVLEVRRRGTRLYGP